MYAKKGIFIFRNLDAKKSKIVYIKERKGRGTRLRNLLEADNKHACLMRCMDTFFGHIYPFLGIK